MGTKLIVNSATSPVAALTGLTMGQLGEAADARQLISGLAASVPGVSPDLRGAAHHPLRPDLLILNEPFTSLDRLARVSSCIGH